MIRNQKIESGISGLQIDNIGVIAQNGLVLEIGLNVQKIYNEQEDDTVKQTISQIREYLEGTRRNFEVSYLVTGSDFEKAVLRAISLVEYGKTISYSELAANAGYPKAIRAVATVCRKNKLPLLIPCHRIIRSNGDIGNYNGGKKLKKYLLDLENNHII